MRSNGNPEKYVRGKGGVLAQIAWLMISFWQA